MNKPALAALLERQTLFPKYPQLPSWRTVSESSCADLRV